MNLFITLFASLLIGCKESDADTAEELNLQSCKIGKAMCVTFYDSISIEDWCYREDIETYYREGDCPSDYIEVCDEQFRSYKGKVVEATLYVKDVYEFGLDHYLVYCD